MCRTLLRLLAILALMSAPAMALTHSPLRSFTGSECGISGYGKNQRKSCGVEHYKSDRGEVCGAEKYNSRTDLSCPGSTANETKYVNVSGRGDPSLIEQSCHAPFLYVTHTQRGMAVKVTCIKYGELKTCDKPEFGVAVWNFCENTAFGDLSYFSCDDPSQPIYASCLIRKSNAELDAYISTVNSDVDYNAQLYASNLGAFLSRIEDKVQMACLIDKYYSNPQYIALIGDLVDKYEANFEETYEKNKFEDQCLSATPPTPQDVSFKEFKCSALTTDDVKNGLKTTTDIAMKRFYNNCFSQKSYELPKSWFAFHLEEIDLLLEDLVAKNDAAVKQSLLDLKESLKSADVVK